MDQCPLPPGAWPRHPPQARTCVCLQEDWRADRAMQAELEALRQDVGPTWLQAREAGPPPVRPMPARSKSL
jgi:hypothetical protein